MIPRIAPLSSVNGSDEDSQLRGLIDFVGYRPNALATMARRDGLLPVILQLIQVALRLPGRLPSTLRFLIACEACRETGCAYTTTHLVHSAHLAGVGMGQLSELDCYLTSGMFSPSDRAALGIASLSPGAANQRSRTAQGRFAQAATFFDTDELAEVVAAIATSRWFATWNGLIGTCLEEEPAAIISDVPWLKEMCDASIGEEHV